MKINFYINDIDTNKNFLDVMEEYVDGDGFLSDSRFSGICEAFGLDDDEAMYQVIEDGRFRRLPNGFGLSSPVIH